MILPSNNATQALEGAEMEQARTITYTVPAYLTQYAGPQDLTPERAPGALSLFNWSGEPPKGYTLVGSAHITVTLSTDDEILGNKVDALRAEKQSVLAEAQAQATRIEKQIQSLLAIEYTPEAA